MFWELIAANRRKSFLLFAGMAALLVTLGYFVGAATMGDGGGNIGIIVAVAVWVIMSAASVFGGPDLVLRMSRAKPVTADVHPQLFNIVEEMKISAGLPAMPKVYIIDEKAPNAFATGLKPENSAIAVTAGLLTKLDRDELQGVIAHETSHILNRDVQFLTLASVMLGSIVLISQVFLRGMWYGGGSTKRWRSSKKSEGGGGGGAPLIVIAIVLAILGPIFARLLYFSISRKREYLADACAVRLTRYPAGLASALEKISQSPLQLEAANQVTAPMFIVAPMQSAKASGWGATHPPIQERIAVLRGMSEGAGFLSYQHSLAKLRGKPAMIMPRSAIQKDEHVAVREAHPEVVHQKSEKEQARDVMDLMRAVNGFAFLMCTCGLKIKVPPEFTDPQIACPRCGRENEIPKAEVAEFVQVAAAVGALVGSQAPGGGEIPFAQPAAGSAATVDAPLEYHRRTRGEWESFSCACGHLLQLSPIFSASEMRCPKCTRITRVV